MYIVELTYLVPLDVVDSLLEKHVAYLNEQYAAGCFLASGRKEPRTGGVILARAESREALDSILSRDPFAKHGVAEYRVITFMPTMTAPGLELLQRM